MRSKRPAATIFTLALFGSAEAFFVQDLAVVAHHPPTAQARSDSVDASCENYRIRILNFGSRSIDAQIATILVGDALLEGGQVDALRNDLSLRGAVYRFGVICSGAREATIRIDRGQRQPGGAVEYKVGQAVFKETQLVSYSGLDEADDQTFWF